MCGIVGMVGHVDTDILEIMMKKMQHRGPDASGKMISPRQGVALGHRRLSIMDPAGGDQPLFNENGKIAIAANGEIYNYPDIHKNLKKKHQIKTGNDSEAILHLFEDFQTESVNRLDGMYAFVIADEEDLFAARDPIGIKPLYWGEINKTVVFASELKAFPPKTQFVKEFPPGSSFHSGMGFIPFYTVPELPYRFDSVSSYTKKIRRTLEQAVVKRLMSDVPLGAFLSGGLDSSIIAAIARQHIDDLHTFSVGIDGSADLQAARTVADFLDCHHHEYVLTPQEVWRKLPEIIYHLESFDQDLVRSAVPCYFTARIASDYVKVILTGEGADELFGGYTYYKDISGQAMLHSELHRSVASLHNINLQRVDRMTMAHGVEGRVPFLDLDMIELGQLIPPDMKIYGNPPIEKWILRKAFEDLLPKEIIWRKKEQFDEGSGASKMMEMLASKYASNINFHDYAQINSQDPLNSHEECCYHRMLGEAFVNSEIVFKNVARWSQRPADIGGN